MTPTEKHRKIAEKIAKDFWFNKHNLDDDITASLDQCAKENYERGVRESAESGRIAAWQFFGYHTENATQDECGHYVENAILYLLVPPKPVSPFEDPCRCWTKAVGNVGMDWFREGKLGTEWLNNDAKHCEICGSKRIYGTEN